MQIFLQVVDGDLRVKSALKPTRKNCDTKYMQNQTMPNYMLSYNDDKNKKNSGKPKDIFKSDKNFFKNN